MIIRNFFFHSVSEEFDSMWPPVKPKLFSRIIAYLTRKFDIVPLESYLDDPKAFSIKKPPATIVFDDGYKDNIDYAAPILAQFNCPASFYVVTDCINRNVPTWTYIIDKVFQQTHREVLHLDFDFVPEKFKKIFFYINGAPNPGIREVKPWMKKLPNPQRLKVLQAILAQCNDVHIVNDKMMNWDHIRQLHGAGFTIGSHSHTHPMLASLQEESEIVNELTTSADIIGKEVGQIPVTISYPVGSFDDRVISIAKDTGYRYGLAVKQRFFKYDINRLFKIPRVELHQEPWWRQQLRISGMYSGLKKIWPGKV